jgi:biopolymer transport protein ExbD
MKLFAGVGGTALVNVSLTLAIIFLFVAMVIVQPPHGHGMILAAANHLIAMPHAMREDAIIVTVMRHPDVFFGNTRVKSNALPDLIRERMSHGSERKAYIRVDPGCHTLL